MAAQSISFFFRHVLKKVYVIPTVIYPRKTSKLPPVMSADEIQKLIDSVSNIKHRTIIMLLYSTGMRFPLWPLYFYRDVAGKGNTPPVKVWNLWIE